MAEKPERRYALALQDAHRPSVIGLDYTYDDAEAQRKALHEAGIRAFLKRHDGGAARAIAKDNAIADILERIRCSACGHSASEHPATGWYTERHCLRCYMHEDFSTGDDDFVLPTCTFSLHDVLMEHVLRVGSYVQVVIAHNEVGWPLYIGPNLQGSPYPIAMDQATAETIARQVPSSANARVIGMLWSAQPESISAAAEPF